MKKKDLLIIGIVAVVALALLGFAFSQRGAGSHSPAVTPAPSQTATPAPASTPTPAPSQTATPAPEAAATVQPGVTPHPTLYPADSYVRVTTATQVFEPIPLVEDGSFRLTQGEGVENVIRVGKNSVHMESATCDNQDCVKQGEVSLENKDTRVLYNMIICLPNQVSLELLTPAEAQTALEEIYGSR